MAVIFHAHNELIVFGFHDDSWNFPNFWVQITMNITPQIQYKHAIVTYLFWIQLESNEYCHHGLQESYRYV